MATSSLYGIPPSNYQTLALNRVLHAGPSHLISTLVRTGNPLCVARFGRTELQVSHRYISSLLGGRLWQMTDSLASGDPYFYFFRSSRLLEGTGIRPLNTANRRRFAELMIEASRQIDVLGSWASGEGWFAPFMPDAHVVRLRDLEPYRDKNPWSQALSGKNVLVVHPYTESIRRQYTELGDAIFGYRGVLPNFSLQTLKPPNAHFGEIPNADGWFSEFETLCEQVSELEFDVAIIGAGPFGMPLASYIKKLGRQAVNLGGATQLLFGILGTRWEKDAQVMSLVNENWTRPLPEEIPPSHLKIEKSAYW